MSEFSVKEYKKIYLSQVTLKHYKVWYKKAYVHTHSVIYTYRLFNLFICKLDRTLNRSNLTKMFNIYILNIKQ